MEKLFYQYRYTPNSEPVKGTVIDEADDNFIIEYGGGTYIIPKYQTRDPWEPHAWEFYSRRAST